MLKKHYRLPLQKKYTFRKSLHSPLFSLRLTTNELSHSRFGIIISKRIDKRATERNRIKRLLSQVLAEHMTSLPNEKDMLFIVKPAIKEATQQQIAKEITKLLHSV